MFPFRTKDYIILIYCYFRFALFCPDINWTVNKVGCKFVITIKFQRLSSKIFFNFIFNKCID